MPKDFTFFQSEPTTGAGSTSPVMDPPIVVITDTAVTHTPAPARPVESTAKPVMATGALPAAQVSPRPTSDSDVKSVSGNGLEKKSEVMQDAKAPDVAWAESRRLPENNYEAKFVRSHTEYKEITTEFAQSEESIAAQDDGEEESAAGNGAWITVLLAFLALVVLGVGVFRYFKTQPSVPQEVACAVSVVECVSKNISAQEGGTISLGKFEVIVPAGALEQDTTIILELLARADFSKFETTDFFRMLPEGLKFKKPVTVKVPYYVAGLRKGTTIEQSLLWFWQGGKIPRKSLAFRVDKETQRLEAEIMKF